MRAQYFRCMYCNTENGLMHTLSIADTVNEESCNIYFIASLKGDKSNSLELNERFSAASEEVDAVVVANLESATIDQALAVVGKNRVRKVILPGIGRSDEDIRNQFLSRGADEVLIMNAGEIFEFVQAGWNVKVACLGKGEDVSLVMFHDKAVNNPKEDDCLLLVKPFTKELPCTTCVDGNNHNCGMRCGLYNDFDTCKGHNGKDSEGYITGTLLLGNINIEESNKVMNLFAENKRQIRFTALPDGGRNGNQTKDLLEWLDTDNQKINQYLVMPSGADGNEGTIKEILLMGGRHIPVLTGKEWGLCASGFFVKR